MRQSAPMRFTFPLIFYAGGEIIFYYLLSEEFFRMDPFFDFLPRGPPPAPLPPNPKRKIQLVLNGNEENPREDNFDPALILKAMNNTFIGRMSDRLEEVDLVSCIQDFVFNSGKVYKNSPQDIARRKWCIAALDERPLQHAGIGKLNPMQSMIACCGSGKSNTN